MKECSRAVVYGRQKHVYKNRIYLAHIDTDLWDDNNHILLDLPLTELTGDNYITSIEQLLHKLYTQGLTVIPGLILSINNQSYLLISITDTAYIDKEYSVLPAWPNLCVIKLNK